MKYYAKCLIRTNRCTNEVKYSMDFSFFNESLLYSKIFSIIKLKNHFIRPYNIRHPTFLFVLHFNNMRVESQTVWLIIYYPYEIRALTSAIDFNKFNWIDLFNMTRYSWYTSIIIYLTKLIFFFSVAAFYKNITNSAK